MEEPKAAIPPTPSRRKSGARSDSKLRSRVFEDRRNLETPRNYEDPSPLLQTATWIQGTFHKRPLANVRVPFGFGYVASKQLENAVVRRRYALPA